MKRIIFFCNESHSFIHYRKDLIDTLISKGYKISCILPYSNLNRKIEKLGIKVYEINYKRHFSVIYDIFTILSLCKIFFLYRFDIIQTITVKPNIYGTIFGFIFGIKKRYALVTGAGPILNKRVKLIGNIRKYIIYKLLRISLSLTTKTIFQNNDDINDFVKLNFLSKKNCMLIEGSGVNSEIFNRKKVTKSSIDKIKQKYKIKNNEKIILLVSRMIISKGIIDVLKASKECKKNYRFIVIAPRENNYFFKEEINQKIINKYSNDKLVLINKFINDIRPFLALSHIALYPSNYREGIPRFLIEALAFGKPIITKKNPGCKVTVEENKNGLFFNNYKEINNKINYLLSLKSKYKLYSGNSYKLFKLRFDSKIIVKNTVEIYEKY